MSVTQLTTYSLTLKRIREQFDLKRPNTTFYAFAGNFPNFDPENVDLGWKDKVHSIFPRQLKALCSPNESFDGIINTKNELGYLGGETKTGYYAHGGNLITVPEFSDGHVYIHDDPYVIDWIRRLTAPGTGVFTGTLDIYGVSALPSTENFGFVQAQKATVAIELQHVGPVLIGPAPYNGYSTVYSANFYIRLYDLFRNYGVHHSPYGDSTLDDTWTFTGGGSPTDGEITFHPAYGVNPAWVEFYSNKGVPFTFRINDSSIPGYGGSPVEVQTGLPISTRMLTGLYLLIR